MTCSRSCFKYKNWFFEYQNGPIWGEKDFNLVKNVLLPNASSIDHVPDAFFGSNYIRLHYTTQKSFLNYQEKNGTQNLKKATDDQDSVTQVNECHDCIWCLEFSPIAATNGMILDFSKEIDCFPSTCGFIPQKLKTKFADVWLNIEKNRLQTLAGMKKIDPYYDWTCTSKYWGSIFVKQDEKISCCIKKKKKLPQTVLQAMSGENPLKASEIPLSLLANTSLPILWFQNCELYSDDLSDSGINETQVKIRVMPDFWFVLYTQRIRVDDVCLRQIEVRLFHQFDSTTVLRELTWIESSYDTLLERALLLAENDKVKTKPSINFSLLQKPNDVICFLTQRIDLT